MYVKEQNKEKRFHIGLILKTTDKKVAPETPAQQSNKHHKSFLMQNYKVSYENWCNISAKKTDTHFHNRTDCYLFRSSILFHRDKQRRIALGNEFNSKLVIIFMSQFQEASR